MNRLFLNTEIERKIKTGSRLIDKTNLGAEETSLKNFNRIYKA